MLLRRERGKTTKTHLDYNPNVEANHNRVVNNQGILEVERLSVLHPARSRGLAEVKIRDEDRQ